MKKFFIEFLKRGLLCASGGPIIVAIVYFILYKADIAASIPSDEVALTIITSAILAFIAAGITTIYQIDKLPMLHAALIHGIVIYTTYLSIYLINGWLAAQIVPFLMFTGIFIVGYGLIWMIVYLSTTISTRKLNSKISNKKN